MTIRGKNGRPPAAPAGTDPGQQPGCCLISPASVHPPFTMVSSGESEPVTSCPAWLAWPPDVLPGLVVMLAERLPRRAQSGHN